VVDARVAHVLGCDLTNDTSSTTRPGSSDDTFGFADVVGQIVVTPTGWR
jgi:hypothetical protein